MSTVQFAAGARVSFPDVRGRNVFLYVVRGAVGIGEARVLRYELAQLDEEGDHVDIAAIEDTVVLFGHAAPIGEPVVAHGPFVMNTREEITQAIQDYQAGKFENAALAQ
jgi:redox-sensitive bicupin YhaK (pirin superfamily)